MRTALVAFVLSVPLAAQADPQGERTIAMDEVRMASQAEVLAVGCGLTLNTKLRDMLHNDATIKLSAEALSGMEQFSRTYTLNLLRRHRSGFCAHALTQFGPEGKQILGLLLKP
jgi:predicted outer membrane protein